MEEACILLPFFRAALLLTGACLLFSSDPRNSVLLGKVAGIRKMDLGKALKTACQIGSTVDGAGLALVLISTAIFADRSLNNPGTPSYS